VPLKIEPLSEHHARRTFSCGEAELDDYFRRRAGQGERRNVAHILVAVSDDLSVAGFYSLSTCAISPGQLPEQIARKPPHYETIPAAPIGRLERDLRARGKGVCELLVADAVKRALGADRSMGIWAILVDAKNQRAADFYRSLGFHSLSLASFPTISPHCERSKSCRSFWMNATRIVDESKYNGVSETKCEPLRFA
jgi:GNAT superfamily N-acetyltransferase